MSNLQIEFSGCPLCEFESEFLGAAKCTSHNLWHSKLPETLEWMKCINCGHVHTRYYWNSKGLDEIFMQSHSNQQADISGNADVKRIKWVPTVDRVIRLMSESGGHQQVFGRGQTNTWMDIGCGDGSLLMCTSDYGFAATGIDVRSNTVEALHKLGLLVHHCDFMTTDFNGQADVLSMMDVLEHLPFPIQALEKAASVLRVNGILVLSLPDMNCSSWRVMDAAHDNPYWIEIEHHHNFSRERIFELLRKCGFEPAAFGIPYRYAAQMEIYAIRK